MPRRFNTTGPCVPGKHYMLAPERRAARTLALIEQEKYFVLRAGRQFGKTTVAHWLVQAVHLGQKYAGLYWDVQTAREDPEPRSAFLTALNRLEHARKVDLPGTAPLAVDALLSDPDSSVRQALEQLTAAASLPLVVFIDEADGLVGKAMVSFLTQLRDGYIDRQRSHFPHSIILMGQREIRDYALTQQERRTSAWLGTSSPFNITAETVTLEPFSRPDVEELLAQHTADTGQCFAREAVEHVWYLSQGHPWLVNALASECVEREVPDPSQGVTALHVESAKERIIMERRTHIDSLLARLREDRIKRVIAPMLVGDTARGDDLDDDFSYASGLGLISRVDGRWQIANPIYREVIPRALTFHEQSQLAEETAWYVKPDGSLDLEKLFVAFQNFWRKDGYLAVEGFNYREAGPHLTLMAFLQRIINGGGKIHREYALGRGALDLLIEWQDARYAVEVKLRRGTETEADAFEQVLRYLDHLKLDAGWLVLFDLRSTAPWKERLYIKSVELSGKRISVVGA